MSLAHASPPLLPSCGAFASQVTVPNVPDVATQGSLVIMPSATQVKAASKDPRAVFALTSVTMVPGQVRALAPSRKGRCSGMRMR